MGGEARRQVIASESDRRRAGNQPAQQATGLGVMIPYDLPGCETGSTDYPVAGWCRNG